MADHAERAYRDNGMSGWEISVFVILVLAFVATTVGFAWWIQWRRDPERFKDGFRLGPRKARPGYRPPGS